MFFAWLFTLALFWNGFQFFGHGLVVDCWLLVFEIAIRSEEIMRLSFPENAMLLQKKQASKML
jgi:hypothetical protein